MNDFLKNIIAQAGDIAKLYFEKGVSYSSKEHLGDLLTEADIAVQNFLVDQISKKYPNHCIHSEEMNQPINKGAQYEWVIDPIDGTRNFAMGIPLWGILIAVLKNNQTIMSAVINPVAQQLFFAEKEQGAFMNGKQIQVNSVDKTDHSFGFTVRRYDVPFEEKFKRANGFINDSTTVWTHNFGTFVAACYLAAGGIDFILTNAGFDHDYLAPLFICQEAGAVVTDSEGKPWTRGRNDVVVANPKLHPKILEFFNM
jgi:myo-inositol-1(or 4)-monophosphatase